MHPFEQFSEILPQPARPVLVRLRRKQRHDVHVHRARPVEEHGETARRLSLRRHERYRVAFPVRPDPVHSRGSVDRLQSADDLHAQRARTVPDAARHDGEHVRLAGLDANAAEAVVHDSEGLCGIGPLDPEVVRVPGTHRRVRAHRERARCWRRALPAHEGIGELEGSILHALGIQPAVGGEVDVLEEHPDHRLRDRAPGTIDPEHQRHRGCRGTPNGGCADGGGDKGQADDDSAKRHVQPPSICRCGNMGYGSRRGCETRTERDGRPVAFWSAVQAAGCGRVATRCRGLPRSPEGRVRLSSRTSSRRHTPNCRSRPEVPPPNRRQCGRFRWHETSSGPAGATSVGPRTGLRTALVPHLCSHTEESHG